LFVKPEVPPIFADTLLPLADFAFPNAYELEYLTGGRTATLPDALAAADLFLAKMRPGATVIITSLLRQDGPQGAIETLAVSKDAAWIVATPRYDAPPHGAGDCFAALFLGHHLYLNDLNPTLGFTATAIHAVIAASAKAGTEELLLVPTQDSLRPANVEFAPHRVR
jgi:pyridoxine kinase